MKKCKKACNKDENCKAFHFYLLDPEGLTNCWIWTVDGYEANGSEKAYCFVKTAKTIEESEDSDDEDEIVDNEVSEVDADRQVP